jgi:NAD(P)H-dependent FMN reductase
LDTKTRTRSHGRFWAINSLREVGRPLHAWVVAEQASIPQAWQEFDDGENLKDPDLNERVNEIGRQVACFADLHGSCEANEFLQRDRRSRS